MYGSPWEDSDGHGEATPSALLLTPSGFRFFHCLPCMAQPPLPLPPAHTTSRDVRHPSFKIYDRFHHRSTLRLRFWRELCRAPTSSPSFDQRTTRRLPPDSGVPSFYRLPPARPLACRSCALKKPLLFVPFFFFGLPVPASFCPFVNARKSEIPALRVSHSRVYTSKETPPPHHTLPRAPSGTPPLRSLSTPCCVPGLSPNHPSGTSAHPRPSPFPFLSRRRVSRTTAGDGIVVV